MPEGFLEEVLPEAPLEGPGGKKGGCKPRMWGFPVGPFPFLQGLPKAAGFQEKAEAGGVVASLGL